ncbi:hypothetical protein TUBRATIS_14420 [Tubulinosema ratisbonensis]|uniref:Uncharacterized protein n=1 Tax=Tubulinosema ratisbonensis TaxID=291195 RepID=A0A437ALL4_9MICR|nr:hypothetical protein TUBRATIS_14420 [Tubulinosema ratisbonensis]
MYFFPKKSLTNLFITFIYNISSSSTNLSIFLLIKGISSLKANNWSNPSLTFSNSLSQKSILCKVMGKNLENILIIPPIKLFTKDLHKLEQIEKKCFFREREIGKIELCGYVYVISDYKFMLVDFYGEFICSTKVIVPCNQLYSVVCKVYEHKIVCMSVRSVSFYEEILFWIEAREYSKIL